MIKLSQLLILVLVLSSCTKEYNQTRLNSQGFPSKEERISRLKEEIKAPTDFEDAEFNLFNVNGLSNSRSSLPGASSWDYQFVIKTNPSNVGAWVKEMAQVDGDKVNIDWTKKLIQHRPDHWRVESQPEIYIREGKGVTVVLYRTEGIFFKRIEQL